MKQIDRIAEEHDAMSYALGTLRTPVVLALAGERTAAEAADAGEGTVWTNADTANRVHEYVVTAYRDRIAELRA